MGSINVNRFNIEQLRTSLHPQGRCATHQRIVGVLRVVPVATFFYLRNWQAPVFVALVLAYVIFRYYRPRRASGLS
jgi:hypothetical protein